MINSQVGLLSHRIELLREVEELKGSLKAEDMRKTVACEPLIDRSLEQYRQLEDKLNRWAAAHRWTLQVAGSRGGGADSAGDPVRPAHVRRLRSRGEKGGRLVIRVIIINNKA